MSHRLLFKFGNLLIVAVQGNEFCSNIIVLLLDQHLSLLLFFFCFARRRRFLRVLRLVRLALLYLWDPVVITFAT